MYVDVSTHRFRSESVFSNEIELIILGVLICMKSRKAKDFLYLAYVSSLLDRTIIKNK